MKFRFSTLDKEEFIENSFVTLSTFNLKLLEKSNVFTFVSPCEASLSSHSNVNAWIPRTLNMEVH